jgi:serine/threonine protein kinase
MSGQIIAQKYEVLSELGEGSYSKVYLVRHVDLGIQYALKVLKRSSSLNETFVERFKHEAGLIQSFYHPGSIQLRDFGRTETGLYYMTTDYSPGVSLEKLLEQEGRFELVRSLKIMLQVLDVLQAAHALGIVHRDIKPANIVIEEGDGKNEIVKILDFGIAQLKQDLPLTSKTTMEGVSIGTPAYMSPEQCTAENDIDQRADIYAAGISLFELITGNVPFLGTTVVQTLLKHLTQPPPSFPSDLKVPEQVSRIVFKALEKEREQRFQSAKEFHASCLEALEALDRKKTQAQPASKQQAAAEHSQPALSPSGESKKLLALDDNEMILQIVRHIFEREGYRVFTATNFSVIHDTIFLEHVPLMLCDVNMPGLPGNKICKMLKQVKPRLKIILFSNIPERDLEKLAAECKADAWLSKNTHPGDWITKVKEIEEGIDPGKAG